MNDQTTFFSYSREDSEFALKLAQDLRQGGANVWLDQINIGAGDRWDLSIERALKDANRMLIILSPESVSSHNVMDEVSYALEEHMKVLPILLKPCDIPFRLRRLQHIDFTENYDKGINKILSILVTENYTDSEGEVANNTLEKEQAFNEEKESKVKKEGKLKEQAEAKRQQEEERKLKEKAEAKRQQEEERKLKEQTEAKRQREERKAKEEQAVIKNAHPSSKGSDKATKKKSQKIVKYKFPLIITGVLVVVAVVLWGAFVGGNNGSNVADDNKPEGTIDSAEIRAWNIVITKNTLPAYDRYIEDYPHGLHIPEARDSLNRIVDRNDWYNALAYNTIEAYKKYLDEHASGLYVAEAQLKIMTIDKQLAEEKQPKPQTLSEKRKQQALSEKKRREEDNAKNAAKIAEDKAWNVAMSTNTTVSYYGYQRDYPSGKYYEKARQKIKELEREQEARNAAKLAENNAWNAAKSSNTIGSYQRYQQSYPNGSYYRQAQQYIDALNPIGIGKRFQGGIIFYIDNTGKHGLVTAEEDLGEYSWQEALNKSLNLRINGFVGWRLPEKDELDKLYQKKDKIGGFSNGGYWSFSMYMDSNDVAWYQMFDDGIQGGSHKNNEAHVRAIRSF